MSTEYFIFVHSNDIKDVLRVISTVHGVEVHDRQLLIRGMLFTEYEELNESSRIVMREDYGKNGLNVNWRIWGTCDESHSSDELLMRLFGCVASIIKTWPEKDASLMRNAESFYAINKSDELMISPILIHDKSGALLVKELSLLKKTTVCRAM